MFGDDSRLRLRRTPSDVLPFTAPQTHRPMPSSTTTPSVSTAVTTSTATPSTTSSINVPPPPPISSGKRIKGNHKMRRNKRRLFWGKCAGTCLSGILAAVVMASLSFSLLPLSWVQVDYHHQVQQAATHLWQRVEENRHNFATAMRGKHSPRQRRVLCADGTIGFENDDYCDCPDGIDESWTSACSHLHVHQKMFPCKSDRTQVIFSSRVGDGVKDCADGSDETPASAYATGSSSS